MTAVEIREVSPRDGLQSEAYVPPSKRAALVQSLADAGLRDIEAAAFVSPRAVPAMADASEVVRRIGHRDGVRWWALAPNRRGVELASASGITSITITVSASDGYSEKNVGCSSEDALAAMPELLEAAHEAATDVVVSCAFGSPYEDVTHATVATTVERLRAMGPLRLTLADTTGAATPRRIADLLDLVGTDVGLHLHDTRGTALANALSALDRGVVRFDTAVGGLGGSPFAPGAGGNLATEDLIMILEDLQVDSGVDLDALLRIAEQLPDLVGHPVPGRVATAGRLPSFPAQ